MTESDGNTIRLRTVVGRTVEQLQADYLDRRRASARAALAQLRKNSSLNIFRDPLTLENVLRELKPPLTEQMQGKGDAPSPSEAASFYALTLFAIHMQSSDQAMHKAKFSFAAACGELMRRRSKSESIKPRFDAMLMSHSEQSRVIHLRSLVTLLRTEKIPFDYGALAEDLRSLNKASRRPGVLLRWGRDFANGSTRLQHSNS